MLIVESLEERLTHLYLIVVGAAIVVLFNETVPNEPA
jgi:hypothetical protein